MTFTHLSWQVPSHVNRDQPAPDTHVEAQAQAELRRSPYPSLHKLSCEHKDGVLKLSGQLSSFYLKQVAQTTVARQLEGTSRIENLVEVDFP